VLLEGEDGDLTQRQVQFIQMIRVAGRKLLSELSHDST
jgi:hypothetical protein